MKQYRKYILVFLGTFISYFILKEIYFWQEQTNESVCMVTSRGTSFMCNGGILFVNAKSINTSCRCIKGKDQTSNIRTKHGVIEWSY